MTKGIQYPVIGKRFGRLYVLKEGSRTKTGIRQYVCKCDCGNLTEVTSGNLRKGSTRSCGCLYNEARRLVHRTHGLSRTPEYAVWRSLINRCYNPSHPLYPQWGAVNVRMVPRWLGDQGMVNFMADMGPKEKHTYLAVDGTEPLIGPHNCRWVERGERRVTRLSNPITWRGETRTLKEWSEHLGIKYKTLKYRVENWPLDEAFTKPVLPSDLTWRKRGWKPKQKQQGTEEAD